jgi:hypothetical protein
MGNLAAVFRAIPATVFNVFEGFPETVTYEHRAPTASSGVEYDTTTGTVHSYPSRVRVGVIFADYSIREREVGASAILPDDRRAMIDAAALSTSARVSLDPAVDDLLVRDTGEAWRVVAVATDPARALWDLRVRRP